MEGVNPPQLDPNFMARRIMGPSELLKVPSFPICIQFMSSFPLQDLVSPAAALTTASTSNYKAKKLSTLHIIQETTDLIYFTLGFAGDFNMACSRRRK